MLVFVVVWLSLMHRAPPRNWLLLGVLYIAFIPVALLYGWLADPRPVPGADSTRSRLPPLLVVGVGAVIAIVGYEIFSSVIDAAFYPT
jgi:hypothetical protein